MQLPGLLPLPQRPGAYEQYWSSGQGKVDEQFPPSTAAALERALVPASCGTRAFDGLLHATMAKPARSHHVATATRIRRLSPPRALADHDKRAERGTSEEA